jgi:hypothetical protein
LRAFRYDGLDLIYRHADHLISLTEVLFLDACRADLLKKGNTVIDLGANIVVLGIGVVEEPGKRSYSETEANSFMADTLENILVRVQKIHFKHVHPRAALEVFAVPIGSVSKDYTCEDQ